ncbi:hypothetical protein HPB51_023765 [Rhipicephalus microplus]|uniref:Uncharacterized protein n=1 Tax=Rhipicephalus microplus TaxID=6941 RepID=A0A9J6E548_RHIMP|nr:hypothetical protein HPB51_023765 [Rhipicephalus microplus]
MGRPCVPNCKGNFDTGPKVRLLECHRDPERRSVWQRAGRLGDIDVAKLKNPLREAGNVSCVFKEKKKGTLVCAPLSGLGPNTGLTQAWARPEPKVYGPEPGPGPTEQCLTRPDPARGPGRARAFELVRDRALL